MRYFFYEYLNGKKDYTIWIEYTIYAGIYIILYCVYLYAVFLNIIINTSYKYWPAYQKISYKHHILVLHV